jgi:hypothetical protein
MRCLTHVALRLSTAATCRHTLSSLMMLDRLSSLGRPHHSQSEIVGVCALQERHACRWRAACGKLAAFLFDHALRTLWAPHRPLTSPAFRRSNHFHCAHPDKIPALRAISRVQRINNGMVGIGDPASKSVQALQQGLHSPYTSGRRTLWPLEENEHLCGRRTLPLDIAALILVWRTQPVTSKNSNIQNRVTSTSHAGTAGYD